MIQPRLSLRSLVAAIGLGAWSLVLAQDPAPAATPAAAPAPPPAPAVFSPGFDDLMTLLVQPRHVKLYYAGTAGNWELAAAEARDLRAALKRIATTLPTYQGNDVDAALTSIIVPKIQAVDASIAAADSKRFVASFTDLTSACNACHTYLEHPFLVIRIPDPESKSLYPDQDFSPSP